MVLKNFFLILLVLLFLASAMVFRSKKFLLAEEEAAMGSMEPRLQEILSMQEKIILKLEEIKKQLDKIELYTNKL